MNNTSTFHSIITPNTSAISLFLRPKTELRSRTEQRLKWKEFKRNSNTKKKCESLSFEKRTK